MIVRNQINIYKALEKSKRKRFKQNYHVDNFGSIKRNTNWHLLMNFNFDTLKNIYIAEFLEKCLILVFSQTNHRAATNTFSRIDNV